MKKLAELDMASLSRIYVDGKYTELVQAEALAAVSLTGFWRLVFYSGALQ